MVRILLALAFGLAFGIEGMTLIRSFLVDQEEDSTEQTADTRSVLREGDVLVPALAPSVRVHRLRVRAYRDEWTFALTARPDSLADRSYTVTFDRLALDGGTELTSAPSHTWPPRHGLVYCVVDTSGGAAPGIGHDHGVVPAHGRFHGDDNANGGPGPCPRTPAMNGMSGGDVGPVLVRR